MPMKSIDIKDQPILGVERTAEICLNGIKYRLFRSVITMTVITVAVAFMMNVICEAIGLQAIAQATAQRTATRRLAARWMERLSSPGTQESVLREMAGEMPGSLILAETQRFSGLAERDFDAFLQDARTAVRYRDSFDDLDYIHRRTLIRNIGGMAVFDHLQNAEAMNQFADALKKDRSIHLPTALEHFQRFLRQWPETKMRTQRIISAREEAIGRVRLLSKGSLLDDCLATADSAWGQQVQDAGFLAFDAAIRKQVAQQALQQKQMAAIEETALQPEARKLVAAYLDVLPSDISTVIFWRFLQKRSAAEWYHQQLARSGIAIGGLTPAQIVALANTRMAQASLETIARLTEESTGGKGFMGIGARISWLLLVSLVMCVVGICNAMLMAVTERFREIATLKCLGALDGFIMLLFLMEAMLLGLVGGVIGGLLGSLIGFGRLWASLGMIIWMAFPAGQWLTALGIAVVTGMGLAGVAGVYPSYMAARLAPMEAMRIE